MTIKGTLETFNLLDLLQMLSFNQKEGTLVLETSLGPRTLYVRRGQFGYVQGDPHPSRALARVLRRTAAVAPERLERALQISANSGRYLGDALLELGAMEDEACRTTSTVASQELFFDLVQLPTSRFEFVEGRCLAPSGEPGAPILPMCAVDAVLLELTRKIDEWSLLRHEVPSEGEVYERTGREPDLRSLDRVPDYLPSRVLPLVDGRRSVAEVIEESDGDRFSVLKLLSQVLRQGAIAPVSTADLQARGEELLHRRMPQQAAALLRRAVERGDALPGTRMRLAEALDASGDATAAAVEYDAFAGSAEATDPAAAFEALRQAMRLRGNDAATAARLCDLWLKDPERVPHRQAEAVAALRILVDAAGRGGSPAEAAARLARFLEAGLAPSEDLLVLADLWASAGQPNEAATALVRRADVLLREGRSVAARDLLRRALLYDATRLDARRRADELDRQLRERRSRRRVVVVLAVVGLSVGTAAAAWLVHDGQAARAAETVIARAESATKEAEATASAALARWAEEVRRAEAGDPSSDGLGAGAAALRETTRRAAERLEQELTAADGEIAERSALGHADAGRERVRALEARGRALVEEADRSVREVGERADRALATGEMAFAEGRFADAKPPLETAIRLSLPGEVRRERARRSLEQVGRYVAAFQAARAPFDAAVARGDTDEAWREAGRLYERFLDCDMTRALRLPVPVAVEPAGATVSVGAAGEPATSPTTVRYSPFGDIELRLRAPGRVPLTVRLPSFADLRDAAPRGGLPPARVHATLSPGPRWASSAVGVTAGPFLADDGLWLVVEDGRRVAAARTDGALVEVPGTAAKDRVREAGRAGSATWCLAGLRTLKVTGDDGVTWETTLPGRLAHAPAFVGRLVVVADDTGTVRALDAATGAHRWESTVGGAPAQAPQSTSLGLALALATGEVVVLAPDGSAKRTLSEASPGHATFAAPWKDGVLVVGASGGLVCLDAAGTPRRLGSGSPSAATGLVATPAGCAWTEDGGVVCWLDASSPEKGPLKVAGAGAATRPPALAPGWLYSVGPDKVLRGVRLDAPDRAAWTVSLPEAPVGGPVVFGDLVVIRTANGLLAYDR